MKSHRAPKRAGGKKTKKTKMFGVDLRSALPGLLEREKGIIATKGSPHPRGIGDQPAITRTFRYKRTTAGTAAITADCLCDLAAIARGGGVGTRYFGQVELLKVEIWGDPNANPGVAPNAIQLTFANVNPDSGRQSFSGSFQAIGTYDNPAHLCVRPGKFNDASRPYSCDSQNNWLVFECAGQIGDVVDVTVRHTLANPILQTPMAVTFVTSGTAGSLYEAAYLDNTSTSPGNGTKMLTSISTWATADVVG